MILTGISNQRDRESRTSDYYNTLRKRIKLNTTYEEAVNAAVDRNISGITKPPPPEENLDKDLNDLNLQKQKAFENIKTIIKKNDEAIKFLNSLEDSEMVPFNKYFAKFKNTTTGIEVKDADFLIKLWDTFKKKTVLTDKETPILGTELENYKTELQNKANDVVDYAAELGLDPVRTKAALDKMVNDSDSAAIDKFYYNLLTKGPTAARVVLKDAVDAEVPPTPAAILTEEVLPEGAEEEYRRKLAETMEKRDRVQDALIALLVRDRPFDKHKIVPRAIKSVDRTLDIRVKSDQLIIKNNLPIAVKEIQNLNDKINKYRRYLKEEPISPNAILEDVPLDDAQIAATLAIMPAGFSLTRPVVETPPVVEEAELEGEVAPIEEKAVAPKAMFDFNKFSVPDGRNLIELMNMNKNQVAQTIYSIHPDGKFEYNGVKYNMKRNPPTKEVQLSYLLKPLMDTYGFIATRPSALFEAFKQSDLYRDITEEAKYSKLVEEEGMAELARERPLSLLQAEIKKKGEEIKQKAQTKAEKAKYIKYLENEAKKLAEKAYTDSQLVFNKTVGKIFNGVIDVMNSFTHSLGLTDIKFNIKDIEPAFTGSMNQIIDNLTNMIVDNVAPDLQRIDDAITKLREKEDYKQEKLDELALLPKSKAGKTLREKLSKNEGEIVALMDFINKNSNFYDRTIKAIKQLRSSSNPIAIYLSSVRPESMQEEKDNLELRLQPLEEAYDQIQYNLNTEGVVIPDFRDEVERLMKSNEPKASKKPKRLVKGIEAQPIKFVKSGLSKKERARRLSIEEEERLRQYLESMPTETEEEKKERGFEPIRPEGEGTRKKKDRLKKIQFGKYVISGKALGSGILDIRTECNRTSAKLPRTPISSRLEKAIEYVIKNNDIDIDLFEGLTPEEKKIFLYAIEIAEVKLDSIPFNVFKRFTANDMNKELDNLIDRYHVLVGELGAGNNAPEILKEIRGILFKLLEKKKIDRIYANELLLMINSVA